MMSKSTPLVEINRNLLGSGLLFLIVGGVLWLAGAVISATALTQAAKKWSPSGRNLRPRWPFGEPIR